MFIAFRFSLVLSVCYISIYMVLVSNVDDMIIIFFWFIFCSSYYCYYYYYDINYKPKENWLNWEHIKVPEGQIILYSVQYIVQSPVSLFLFVFISTNMIWLEERLLINKKSFRIFILLTVNVNLWTTFLIRVRKIYTYIRFFFA